MNFMEITNLNNLGYEKEVNNNIFQDIKRISLEDDYVEEVLISIAYDLESEFYFSIAFYNDECAYSVVKIDGKLYEKYLETKEDIQFAIENSYSCNDVAIFKLKDNILECIGY